MDKIMLSDAKPGMRYSVLHIPDEARLTNRLSSMGVMTGSQIEICQNNRKQPVLLFARDTLIAIGRDECKKILLGGQARE